jgi:ubiquinone/menaquinone biosynthesis C-methylase UbiE
MMAMLGMAGMATSPALSLYDRFAPLYADFRLHVFPDDRAEIAAALDLHEARSFAELGCGPGFYATAFAAAYPQLRVTGIDRAPAQVALARQRIGRLTNVRFIVGDARALSQPDAVFDRVFASRLLMVVPEREVVLAEARRMLAPGGILLLAEPSRQRMSVLRLLHRAARAAGGPMEYIEPPGEHYFSAASFRALIASQQWASVARCRAPRHSDGS